MGSFYHIGQTSTSVMSCFASSQAQVVTKVTHENPGYDNQSWQFIAVLGASNTYYLRNEADVYLQASGETVFSASSGLATQWVLVPQMPILGKIPYKIKAWGTDSWMVIGEDGAVGLGSSTNAYSWDVQLQDSYPLENP